MHILVLDLMISTQINQTWLQSKESKCLSFVLKHMVNRKLNNDEMVPGMPGISSSYYDSA